MKRINRIGGSKPTETISGGDEAKDPGAASPDSGVSGVQTASAGDVPAVVLEGTQGTEATGGTEVAKVIFLDDTHEKFTGALYSRYSEAVGGKAWNGDALPDWPTFRDEPAKVVQVRAWAAAALLAIEEAADLNKQLVLCEDIAMGNLKALDGVAEHDRSLAVTGVLALYRSRESAVDEIGELTHQQEIILSVLKKEKVVVVNDNKPADTVFAAILEKIQKATDEMNSTVEAARSVPKQDSRISELKAIRGSESGMVRLRDGTRVVLSQVASYGPGGDCGVVFRNQQDTQLAHSEAPLELTATQRKQWQEEFLCALDLHFGVIGDGYFVTSKSNAAS